MTTFPRSALLLAIAVLPGCAASGNFPSLAPRAVERDGAGGMALADCPDFPADRPAAAAQAAAATPSDPQLRARVTTLIAEARAGQAEFAAILGEAEQAVAEAGASGSEEWVEAQQELSRACRVARATEALTQLDSLSIGRGAERSISVEDLNSISQAAAEARALADRQTAELVRLSDLLGPP